MYFQDSSRRRGCPLNPLAGFFSNDEKVELFKELLQILNAKKNIKFLNFFRNLVYCHYTAYPGSSGRVWGTGGGGVKLFNYTWIVEKVFFVFNNGKKCNVAL